MTNTAMSNAAAVVAVVALAGALSGVDAGAQLQQQTPQHARGAPQATLPADAPLWPAPALLVELPGGGSIGVDSAAFSFAATGQASGVLSRAFTRYQAIMFATRPAGRATAATVAAAAAPRAAGAGAGAGAVCAGVDVNVSSASLSLGIDTDESYALTVDAPRAQLSAATVYGALRGLETLSQLVMAVPAGPPPSRAAAGYAALRVHVDDSPRFPFRGLMMDTARRWLPLPLLRAVVDAMSYDKLNVLHLHLTDDQSWPLELAQFPNLTATGAFSPSRVYSAADVSALVSYARDRGVRVVPEVDSPGHSLTWVRGAPPGVALNCSAYGQHGATAVVDPTVNATWAFLERLFAGLGDAFPDEAVHIGGDEVAAACWAAVPRVAAWLRARGMPTNASTLQAYYEQRLTALVRSPPLNRTVLCWEEVFHNTATPARTLGADAIVDVWKSDWQATMNAVTNAGLRAVLSHPWYLDMLGPATSWADEWAAYYAVEPTDFGGSAAQRRLVVGGHGALWGEAVDGSNALQRAWPRASAVAERLWSPRATADLASAARRLHAHRCRMLRRGIRASPVGCLRSPLNASRDMYASACWCDADDEFDYQPPGGGAGAEL